MSEFRHGLVLGKFYPPHDGHRFLVRAAAAFCDRVTVAVLAATAESIPLAERVRWLAADVADTPHVTVAGALDDHPIDYDDPAVWDLHVAVLDAVLAGERVDAVFSAEPYGAELARQYGAADVRLDRTAYPVSGSAVRADPVVHWDQLGPGARTFLAKRVVVVGAESTGTTTLSRDLAAALRARGGAHAYTRWVPEYGREYTLAKMAVAGGAPPEDLVWTHDDFARVARQQCADEDRAAAAGGPVLVCDTDAFATLVWEERYAGAATEPTRAAAAAMPSRAVYLLTGDAGVAFEQDGMRDGAHLRAWMTGRFREELAAQGVPWHELTGDREQRLAAALGIVDDLLARGWSFG